MGHDVSHDRTVWVVLRVSGGAVFGAVATYPTRAEAERHLRLLEEELALLRGGGEPPAPGERMLWDTESDAAAAASDRQRRYLVLRSPFQLFPEQTRDEGERAD